MNSKLYNLATSMAGETVTPYREPPFFSRLDGLVSDKYRRIFGSNKIDFSNCRCVGLVVALEEAIASVGRENVMSMPLLIAGKASVEKNHELWKYGFFDCLSEEYAGIDTVGVLGKKGEELVVVVHGGGLLTPERIRQAYTEGLVNGAAVLKQKEFTDLLGGVLPSGKSINVYSLAEVRDGISDPFGMYGVWLPASKANAQPSDFLGKSAFLRSELVLARAGMLDFLEDYFDKAKGTGNVVGSWHHFGINFAQSQGRLAYLGSNYIGLNGSDNLNSDGRFVVVRTGRRTQLHE